MDWASASQLVRALSSGEQSALAIADAALARIGRLNATLNAFTDVVAERARIKARALDRARQAGKPLGALACRRAPAPRSIAGVNPRRATPL
jgi:1-carboxybiuret hydrolase